ncbi:MAG TPA: hypothetical protein VFH43_04300 [Candidatus Kapabacteria bacterium]|nr:hypothetical protein [Candidatus Kapabacteria bacterium]
MQRIASGFSRCLLAGLCFLIAGCVADGETSRPLQAERVSIRKHFLVEAGEAEPDSLYPLFPNPFNRDAGDDSINIQFSLEDTSRVIILIQNPVGEEVIRFEDETLSPGQYRAGWNPLSAEGEPLNSGIYFVTYRTDEYIVSRMLSILTN